MIRIQTNYLDMALNPGLRTQALKNAMEKLKHEDFDTIACRGVSGLLFAPILAHLMDKQLVVVRKPGESTHSGFRIEGNITIEKYIIVDDFCTTGATMRAIIEAIRNETTKARCVNFYGYHYNELRNFMADAIIRDYFPYAGAAPSVKVSATEGTDGLTATVEVPIPTFRVTLPPGASGKVFGVDS